MSQPRPAPTDAPLSDEELHTHAAELAAATPLAPRVPRRAAARAARAFSARLERLRLALEARYVALAAAQSDPDPAAAAAQATTGDRWLLDNDYLILRTLRTVARGMPPGYHQTLPRGRDGQLRVATLVDGFLRSSGNEFDPARLRSFVAAYQSRAVLTLGELWALPSFARLALLERLAAPPEPTRDEAIAAAVLGLHAAERTDWIVLVEQLSVVEQCLRGDPAGIYPRMDEASRSRTRAAIEELARWGESSEEAIAEAAIHLAREAAVASAGADPAGAEADRSHVGAYLIGERRRELERRLAVRPPLWHRLRRALGRRSAALYGVALAVGALLLMAPALAYTASRGARATLPLLLLALAAPALLSVEAVLHGLVPRLTPPRTLPKLDLSAGIPTEARTLVAVPALIAHPDDAAALAGQLERHYAANPDPNLEFALLSDFADAPAATMPEDASLLARLRDELAALRRRRPEARVHLLHRTRRWNSAEGCWMGWERKRGKLIELNRLLLHGDKGSFDLLDSDLAGFGGFTFVLTLDVDTVLQPGGAARLIGVAAHPLNRPRFGSGDRPTSGYTLFQPRVEPNPEQSGTSRFGRWFSAGRGVDLYDSAASDPYMDLFGEGIFVGKGIYRVAAFQRSVDGRVPDNAVLSHDLLEAGLARAALVSDVILYESTPTDPLAWLRRRHRWTRGDWQLLPWLAARTRAGEGTLPNPLPTLARWWIARNLLASLFEPSLLALLALGWWWLPGAPLGWTLLALLVAATPPLLGHAMSLRGADGWRELPAALRGSTRRWLVELALLPAVVASTTDAVARTLLRLRTGRHLLRWNAASHAEQRLARTPGPLLRWRMLAAAPLVALASGALSALLRPAVLPVALPFLAAWVLAPQLAWLLGRPVATHAAQPTAAEARLLERIARRTWLWFERFVGPEDNWLPPDHFQELPLGQVAHRTSPTNIGLLFTTTLGAFDLGFCDARTLLLRLRGTLDTMARLERHRGHLLNWYDTRTLEPLPPRYVSTVDSGNLQGCLLAVQQGVLELPQAAVLRSEGWRGLTVLLELLAEAVDRLPAHDDAAAVAAKIDGLHAGIDAIVDAPERWSSHLDALLADALPAFDRLLLERVHRSADTTDTGLLADIGIWTERLHEHARMLARERDVFLPWWVPEVVAAPLTPAVARTLASFPVAPTFAELPALYSRLRHALAEGGVEPESPGMERLRLGLDIAEAAAAALRADTVRLADALERELQAPRLDFLYDHSRHVFRIGYHVDDDRLDEHAYDLLASEARIGSFVAIAMARVAADHWLHLGRPLTLVGGVRTLLSWSGSMFEYLMPTLLMRAPADSLLGVSARSAVDRQIAYGDAAGIPWGISESGYARTDAQGNYQYRAFGVPELALSRAEPAQVVAPYATVMALGVAPAAALANLERLIAVGALGRYGFYEALDHSVAHLPLGETCVVVRSYMTHHHGMGFLALCNRLRDDVFVRRFHADPRVRAAALLLFEATRAAPLQERIEVQPGEPRTVRLAPAVAESWSPPRGAPAPQLHSLSNGRFTLFASAAGGGGSRWEGIDLTRWRSDATRDAWGSWIYLHDLGAARGSAESAPWSATPHPCGERADESRVRFHPHAIEYLRRDGTLGSRLELVVPPHDDLEIRRVSLSNHGDAARRISLTSYGEVALAPHGADLRHPAFQNLFVESAWLPELRALHFTRRARRGGESPPHLLHAVVIEGDAAAPLSFESDRSRFLGRWGDPRAPAGVGAEALSGSTGATLDPIFALRTELTLEPDESRRLAFVTIAGRSRADAVAVARRYRSWSRIEAAFEAAHERQLRALARLDLGVLSLADAQRMLSRLLYPGPELGARPELQRANRRGQPGLWAHGISGDHPILLLRVVHEHDLELAWALLGVHRFWREQGFEIDLVLLDEADSGYLQTTREALLRRIASSGNDPWLGRPGGIHLLFGGGLGDAERALLEAAARVVVGGGERAELPPLRAPEPTLPSFAPPYVDAGDAGEPEPLARPDDLRFDNGWGGFDEDGSYRIYHDIDHGSGPPPAPWVNVLANPEFGSLVSDGGASFSWALNSSEFRLTPWSNDPVIDPSGEVLYLRDEESAALWSPTPQPLPGGGAYGVRHEPGATTFRHRSHGLEQELRVFVPPDAPLKVLRLRLHNLRSRPRRITATLYLEWVLGTARETDASWIVPEYHAELGALLARNPRSEAFAERVAFVAGSVAPHGLTTDRREFLGVGGSTRDPVALRRVGLSGRVAAGGDPCAALQLHLDLPAGRSVEVGFVLGCEATRDAALERLRGWRAPARQEAAWNDTRRAWQERLGALQVSTPDPAMDLLLNRWLPLQTLACRVWGRSAFYQSGGAYGFRDQLQDTMALLHAAPEEARAQLRRAARHQFEEGDVLHWWHPPEGRGVRTRISDDLAWLPYALAHYVETTGDTALLDETEPYLVAPELAAGEAERYDLFPHGERSHPLFDHACRALDRALTTGVHGLPRIGGGDWNDGMDRVGSGGAGESVWLAWFLIATLERFAPLCDGRGDGERGQRYRQRAQAYREAVEAHAWDGDWYLRAFYDDGTPLGSSASDEARIDAIAQAWAVLSGAADPQRAARAMEAVDRTLVREDDGLVLLLTPPFDRTARDPGYIKGYPPGVRENGGQYTHAALWTAWAFAELGRGDRAHALFRLLSPIRHADTADRAARYRVEPYVVAADVYGAPPHTGRGGWSWYTGSAAWMYRLGTEAILGLRRRGNALELRPCIPAEWPGYDVRYRFGSSVYHIRVDNPERVGGEVVALELDGGPLVGATVALVDDGREHRLEARLGVRAGPAAERDPKEELPGGSSG